MRIVQRLVFVGLATAYILTGGVTSGMAMAQTAVPGGSRAPSLDAKAQSEVVEAAAKALTDKYIFPDKAAVSAALIRDNLQNGRYAGLDREGFAKRLTDDLRGVTHDKHLNVTLEGAPPPVDAPPQAQPPATMFGFERADRLKGNIGYVKLNGFHPPEALSVVADALMPKLARTKALIIDMRDNHGGDPAGVSRLVSFFVAAGAPVHVNDIVWRKAGTDEYSRETFSTSPTAATYRNKPVYVLTGPGTFSGGEEFSYDMQVMKLATLVGETTGGGSNPGDEAPLGAGFAIFLPNGRAENPITKGNWEGVGVKPDISVPADRAFATAYAAALRATHQKQAAAAVPDPVSIERLLVLRTKAYPQGEAYIRREIDGLVKGEHAFDILSPAVAAALKGPVPAGLRTMMQALGPVQSVRFVKVDPLGSDEYEVTFAHSEQIWILAINEAGKIIIFNFRPK